MCKGTFTKTVYENGKCMKFEDHRYLFTSSPWPIQVSFLLTKVKMEHYALHFDIEFSKQKLKTKKIEMGCVNAS